MNAKRFGGKAEIELRDWFKQRGYFCIRSAASKTVDLVVSTQERTYGIEVKATHSSVVCASRTAEQRRQWQDLMNIDHRYDLVCAYAVRFGDGVWRLFSCTEPVLREHEGLDIASVFPKTEYAPKEQHDTPNIPPIVPQEG